MSTHAFASGLLQMRLAANTLAIGYPSPPSGENHEKFHEKYDSAIIEKLNEMSFEQLSFVTNTFEILEERIDHYLNDLK